MTWLRSLSNGRRDARIVVLVVLLQLVFSGLCVGDQYQWSPLSVCEDAAWMVARLPFIVSYCSLADEDYVELWVVRNLQVATTPIPDLYELVASAERLYRSDRAFSSDEFPVPREQWTFHDESDDVNRIAVGVDLAYVYVYVGGGSFRCLAQLLGLPCVVEVETIRLPDRVLGEIAARWGITCHTTL
jgi:hypothetical protein